MARGDTKIITTKNIRPRVLKGAKTVYKAVSAAYGPTSGNVALEKNYGSIVISHDGVSIAKEVVLQDKVEDIGADLLIQASDKSNDVSGDGTTASILMGYHIMRLANQRIAAGFNPMGLRRGINRAALELKEHLDKLSKPVPDSKLAEVATISASDEELGKLVADTIVKVGGVGITIEEYDGLGVIQDVIEGLYFEKGWTMPHFVTDRQTEEVVHEDIHILALEKRISANQDIVPLIEMIHNSTDYKTVLFIGNITDKALETCALTNLAGKVKICVVPPPVYGDQMLGFLEDVAIMTGGKLVPSSMPADKVDASYAGFANKVIITKQNTTIIEGAGAPSLVKERVKILEKQLKDPKFTAPQRERIEKRLAKLKGSIGIIKVGGATDAGRREMKFRVEDAVHATRAAKEQGIVAGGATALVHLSTIIETPLGLSADEEEGFRVVMKALREPFKQLLTNAGEDAGYRLAQVLRTDYGKGFNVKEMTDEPIKLIDAGVIDPTKVIKSVVENACEVAGIAITLSAAINIDRQYQLEQVQINKALQ